MLTGPILALAIETLTIIGKDGSVAAIPFPDHGRCLEAICILSEHKTCAQVTAMQEARFTNATKQWESDTAVWNAWRKTHPCVDHIASWSGGDGWTAFTDKGKVCPMPPSYSRYGMSFMAPSAEAPKHDDIVKFPAIPNVTSAECVK